jgi:hypothetical protein
LAVAAPPGDLILGIVGEGAENPGKQNATQSMNGLYAVVVALTVVAHFAFLAYLVVGGFLALRFPRTIWLHVPVVMWGIGTVWMHLECPLTWLERWARSRAGMDPLPSEGFIDHYITGLLYPASAVGVVEAVVFSTVCVSWLAYVAARRGSAARPAGSDPSVSTRNS